MAPDIPDESWDAAASGMPTRRMKHAASRLKHGWRLLAYGARGATTGSAHGNRR